jgi:F-type H+-transporting ATPase subunit epsilon
MKLEIVTPVNIEFSGEISTISLPGKFASFSIRKDHAPIIASLKHGIIKFVSDLNNYEIETGPGVVEAKDNNIVVCIEYVKKNERIV